MKQPPPVPAEPKVKQPPPVKPIPIARAVIPQPPPPPDARRETVPVFEDKYGLYDWPPPPPKGPRPATAVEPPPPPPLPTSNPKSVTITKKIIRSVWDPWEEKHNDEEVVVTETVPWNGYIGKGKMHPNDAE